MLEWVFLMLLVKNNFYKLKNKMEHKVYFQNQNIKELLWERYISEYRTVNWPSYDIDTFCWRLISALIYLKKDNSKKLLDLYKNLFNKTTEDIDHAYDEIFNLVEINKSKRIIWG